MTTETASIAAAIIAVIKHLKQEGLILPAFSYYRPHISEEAFRLIIEIEDLARLEIQAEAVFIIIKCLHSVFYLGLDFNALFLNIKWAMLKDNIISITDIHKIKPIRNRTVII